jgi:1,4-dihydroxy-2-naphthoate polyprenyltransferase
MAADLPLIAPLPPIRPGSWAAWCIALRPRTLWIAMIPVLVATSLAWSVAGVFDAATALIALVASVAMQVVTNLQNDVGYTERRVAASTRVGLPRATANGWLPASAVRWAIVATVATAVVVALPLLIRGGLAVFAIGASSTIAAYCYMGGPRPIAYTPFGELTVFVFFGLVAVCGTYYIEVGSVDRAAAIAAAAIGAHAAAVLLVNNFRDRSHDAATGRRTLPVVIGITAAIKLYAVLELIPFVLAALLAALLGSAWLALPLVVLPWALRLAGDLGRTPDGLAQNALMFRSVMLEVTFGVLLSAGAIAHGSL